MPGESVDAHAKTMFLRSIHNRAQQIRARMKAFVNIIQIKGENAAYDGLGSVEAQEISGRFNKVIFSDIEHTRREIPRRRFAVAIPIDKKDVNDIMRDTGNEYAVAIVRAIERVFDRISIEAAFSAVNTGKSFGTAVTAANDGVETIDATGGLLYDHLNQMRGTFINNDVGTDMPETYFLAITGDEHRALLADHRTVGYDAAGLTLNMAGKVGVTAASWEVATNPLTDSRFTNRTGRIDNGVLVNAAGFNIVAFAANAPNPVLETVDDTTDHRRCVAASTRGIVVGIHDDVEVKRDERPDYYQVVQVTATITLGAVRTEGVLVQELQTSWTAA